ncbi:MAG: hypothetical protein HZC17_02905 [Candidatus Omnitrophica bacterium]|nr:hypothetical protein [Candidatus Omnitrophota bacterium]
MRVFPSIVVAFIALFLFSGFLFFGKNDASASSKKKQTIAILPVDKATGNPLTTHVGRKLGQDWLEKSFGNKVNLEFLLSNKDTNDPLYVQKRVYVTLGRALRHKKYEVADPVSVFTNFNSLAWQRKEVDLKELSKRVPADAYLFVTITLWDTDDFDKIGMMNAGYLLQLLDGKTEKLIWQKEVPKKRFRIRQNQNRIAAFTQFYDEMIETFALDMLKKFPKHVVVPSQPFEVQAKKV